MEREAVSGQMGHADADVSPSNVCPPQKQSSMNYRSRAADFLKESFQFLVKQHDQLRSSWTIHKTRIWRVLTLPSKHAHLELDEDFCMRYKRAIESFYIHQVCSLHGRKLEASPPEISPDFLSFLRRNGVLVSMVDVVLRGLIGGFGASFMTGLFLYSSRKIAGLKANTCRAATSQLKRAFVCAVLTASGALLYSIMSMRRRYFLHFSILQSIGALLRLCSTFDSSTSRLLKKLVKLEFLYSKFSMPYPPSTLSVAERSQRGITFRHVFEALEAAQQSHQILIQEAILLVRNEPDLCSTLIDQEPQLVKGHAPNVTFRSGAFVQVEGGTLNHFRRLSGSLKEARLRLLEVLLFVKFLSGPNPSGFEALTDPESKHNHRTLAHRINWRILECINTVLTRMVRSVEESIDFVNSQLDYDGNSRQVQNNTEAVTLQDLSSDKLGPQIPLSILGDMKVVDSELQDIRLKLEGVVKEVQANALDERTLASYLEELSNDALVLRSSILTLKGKIPAYPTPPTPASESQAASEPISFDDIAVDEDGALHVYEYEKLSDDEISSSRSRKGRRPLRAKVGKPVEPNPQSINRSQAILDFQIMQELRSALQYRQNASSTP
ncbi:hypothetical protein HDU67_000773 [Dinochytrium kinnereticum]|nr:hypothetical protein HDU67_000773 [Dinochytrium kinnereticum]